MGWPLHQRAVKRTGEAPNQRAASRKSWKYLLWGEVLGRRNTVRPIGCRSFSDSLRRLHYRTVVATLEFRFHRRNPRILAMVPGQKPGPGCWRSTLLTISASEAFPSAPVRRLRGVELWSKRRGPSHWARRVDRMWLKLNGCAAICAVGTNLLGDHGF